MTDGAFAVPPGTLAVAGLAALRLVELVHSRRNRARMRTNGARPAHDPGYVAMVRAHVTLLVGCAVEPWIFEFRFVPAIGGPALVLLALAELLRAFVLLRLGPRWNTGIMLGAGVVARGPYRFVRHPNYVVVLLEFFTLPLVCSAWVTFVIAQLVHTPILLRRVEAEERALFTLPEYRRTMGSKPRFLPWGAATAPGGGEDGSSRPS